MRVPFSSLAQLATLSRTSGGVDLRRMPRMIALVVRYLVSEPLVWLERAFVSPKVAAHQMPDDPIFVLGHWRSGTTYLQHVLSHDPQMVTPSLFDTLFADVGTVTRPWLKPTLNRLARMFGMAHSMHRVPMNLDLPGETDVALCSQLSPFSSNWGHLFPRRFEFWMARSVLDPDPQDMQAWLDAIDTVARKCSWAAGGRRVVLKSPGDTARVAVLLARYPNARFIYIHRDPISVFHSNRYLWRVVLREFSLQNVPDEDVDGIIIRTYRSLLERYLAQRDRVPTTQLVEVQYEDLLQDPVNTLRRVYAQLGLGPVPDVLCERLAAAETHCENVYETEPELETRLRDEWAFAFERWPPRKQVSPAVIRQMEQS